MLKIGYKYYKLVDSGLDQPVKFWVKQNFIKP